MRVLLRKNYLHSYNSYLYKGIKNNKKRNEKFALIENFIIQYNVSLNDIVTNLSEGHAK